MIGAFFNTENLSLLKIFLIKIVIFRNFETFLSHIFYSVDSNKLFIIPIDSLGNAFFFISIMFIKNIYKNGSKLAIFLQKDTDSVIRIRRHEAMYFSIVRRSACWASFDNLFASVMTITLNDFCFSVLIWRVPATSLTSSWMTRRSWVPASAGQISMW